MSQTGDREGESFISPEQQHERIRVACERDGIQLVKVYEELDVSGGAALADRPGLSKAVAAIEAGTAEVVAAAYFDRLFRSLATQSEVVDRVERVGGRVLAVDVGQVTNGSAGQWLTGTVLGTMSEFYRRSAKERSNEVADDLVARGIPNRVPFGYRRNGTFVDGRLASKVNGDRDGKALVPDPSTAPYLVRIFEMRRDGYAWTAIGQWLQEEGVLPPRGGIWAVSTLRNVIANEMYLGVVKLGDRRLAGAHDPLVSLSLWKAAQSSKTIQRTGRNAAGIGGGLLVCANCGRRLTVTGGQNPSYTCRRGLGGRCVRPVYVSKRRADAHVEHWVLEALRGQGEGMVAIEAIATSQDVARLRDLLADANGDLEGYVLSAKALDAALFKRGLEARQDRVREIQDTLDTALAAGEDAAELPNVTAWDSLDLDRQRQVARALIDFVAVEDAQSRGPGADVEFRLDIFWRGEDRESYPPGLSPR